MRDHLSFRDRPHGESLLLCEQLVPRSIGIVFAFHADVCNLERITPPFLHFAITAVSTAAIGEGTLINFSLRVRGVPMHWRSRIESWQPPCRFVDRQVCGPYALWPHTHEFEAHAGGTLVRDPVRYRLPLGAVGVAIASAFVRRDPEAIFTWRRHATRAPLVASARSHPCAAAVRS